MKNLKKPLALLLAFVMVLGVLNLTAFAESITGSPGVIAVDAVKAPTDKETDTPDDEETGASDSDENDTSDDKEIDTLNGEENDTLNGEENDTLNGEENNDQEPSVVYDVMLLAEDGGKPEAGPGENDVAEVNGEYFETLQAAIAAAHAGDTVTLLKDVEVETWNQIWNVEDVTINGGGHTLKVNKIESGANGNYLLYSAKNLTVSDLNIEIGSGSAFDMNGGKLEKVTFNGGKYGVVTGSYVTITDCTFTGQDETAIYTAEDVPDTDLKITGCTFTNTRATILRANEKFTGNTISGNAGELLSVLGPEAIITGNTIKGSGNLVLYGNVSNIKGNTIQCGVQADGVTAADLSGNYWGGSEPTELPEGVTFTSYYTDAEMANLAFGPDVAARVGDDVYTDLRDAIDAAGDGDTVTLLKDVEVNSKIFIDGYILDGNNKTLTSTLNGWSIQMQGTGSALKNLTVNPAKNQWAVYIAKDSENLTIDGCTFNGSTWAIYGPDPSPETVKNVTISNNVFNNRAYILRYNTTFTGNVVNVGKGVTIAQNAENVGVTGNIFNSARLDVYPIDNAKVIIEKNQFLGSSYLELENPPYIYTEPVDLSGNYWGGSEPTGLPENVIVASYYTDPEMTNLALGSDVVARVGDNVYTDIQAAIAAANSGDTVTILKAGEYVPITVPDGVTIKAAEGENVIFKGSFDKNAKVGSNVTFEGITFEDATPLNYSIGDSLTVRNCKFIGDGSGTTAMYIHTPNITVTGCTFENYRRGYYTCGDNYAAGKITFTDNTFVNVTIPFDGYWGKPATEDTLITVSGNKFSDGSFVRLWDYTQFLKWSGSKRFNDRADEGYMEFDSAVNAVVKDNTGSYTLMATHCDWLAVTQVETDVTPVNCRLVGIDGELPAGAKVKAVPVGTLAGFEDYTTATDKGGKLYFYYLPDGDYTVDIIYSNGAVEHVPLTVGPQEKGTTLTLTLNAGENPKVAKVGETEYEDIQDAIEAAKDGGTVTLLKDVEVGTWNQIWDVKNATIDGDGYTLTVNGIFSNVNGDYLLYNAENLTVRDLKVVLNGGKGAFDLKSGTLENVTVTGGMYAVLPGGPVKITNCTFKDQKEMAIYTNDETGAPGMVVDSCTFENTRIAILRADEQVINCTATGPTKYYQLTTTSTATVITGNTFSAPLELYNQPKEISRNNFSDMSGYAEGNMYVGSLTSEPVVVDLSGNYWGGAAPAEMGKVIVNTWYTTLEMDDSFSLSAASQQLTAAGETVALTVSGGVAGKTEWTSSDPGVATVDANGVVTAVANGTATITATVGDKTAACAVTVSISTDTEEPGTEDPGTEEPGTEEPGTEEPGTEEPGTEEPGTDNGTGTTTPSTPAPDTTAPAATTPVTAAPAATIPGAPAPTTPTEEVDEPDVPLTEQPEQPGEEIGEPDVPLAGQPDEEVGESDVPLATAPKTSNNMVLWLVIAVISAAAIFMVILLGKRKKDEET